MEECGLPGAPVTQTACYPLKNVQQGENNFLSKKIDQTFVWPIGYDIRLNRWLFYQVLHTFGFKISVNLIVWSSPPGTEQHYIHLIAIRSAVCWE